MQELIRAASVDSGHSRWTEPEPLSDLRTAAATFLLQCTPEHLRRQCIDEGITALKAAFIQCRVPPTALLDLLLGILECPLAIKAWPGFVELPLLHSLSDNPLSSA